MLGKTPLWKDLLIDFAKFFFLSDHFFVKFVPDTNRFSYFFCNSRFLFFPCWFFNWCKSLKGFIEKSENRSLLKESMLKSLKSLEVVFIRILFRLLPLKFSRMINWRRWSEIKVVMWPESYLKDGLFTKNIMYDTEMYSKQPPALDSVGVCSIL